ncbi:MAG: acyloxyacyl hydrolase [Opitutales bacterium]
MPLKVLMLSLLSLVVLGAAEASWIDPWKTWEGPDEQSWVITATFKDSDEDAVYAAQRAWRRRFGEDSRWLLGWEVGAGVADSGKYEQVGALATLDLVLKRELWTYGPLDLGFNGIAGLQLHTIDFPGGSFYNGRLGLYFDLGWAFSATRAIELRAGYLHISNANLGHANEGLDAIWLGAGLRW